jgi:acyl-coenzyme A thioesterase PaaI-like protein
VSDASKIHIHLDQETFWGFLDVPFHQQMGITFRREDDGTAVVGLPHDPELVNEDGEQSPAALYSIAEIASALRVCDEMADEAKYLPEGMYPVMLARNVQLLGDRDELVTKIKTKRKGMVEIAVGVSDDEGSKAAEARFDFYVRVMSEERLLAMTAAAVGGGAGN